VIAREHGESHACVAHREDQPVVKLARVARRRAGIEDVAGYQDRVDAMDLRLLDEPRDQLFMFRLPGMSKEILAEMPVGGVQDSHR